MFGVSLVFASTPDDANVRWRELAFMEIMSHRSNSRQPFPLNPMDRAFSVAMSNVVGRHQVAHGPFVIDGEDEDSFQDRWLRLFAKAARGQLMPPTHLPLTDAFYK